MSRHSSAHWQGMEGILGYNKARSRFHPSSLWFLFFLLLLWFIFSTIPSLSLAISRPLSSNVLLPSSSPLSGMFLLFYNTTSFSLQKIWNLTTGNVTNADAAVHFITDSFSLIWPNIYIYSTLHYIVMSFHQLWDRLCILPHNTNII